MDNESRGGGRVTQLLVEARQRAGLTQADVGSRAQVSRSRVIGSESGGSLPTFEVAARLARVLEIPLEVMVDSLVQDSLQGAPESLQELEGIKESSAWLTYADRLELVSGSGAVRCAVEVTPESGRPSSLTL